MATLAVQLDEESLVRTEVAKIALPKGVRLKKIEQGADWTGDPALRIYFSVSKSLPITKRRISELASLDRLVVDRILELKLGKWPFVHFLDGR